MRESALGVVLVLPLCWAQVWAQDAGEERTNPADGAVMVWVPATSATCRNARFLMGITPAEVQLLVTASGWSTAAGGAFTDAQPAHEVELDGFWCYKHEVTNLQYGEFLEQTGRQPPEGWEAVQDLVDLPVGSVTWEDAAAYAEWAGGRLPIEAQREYVARGPEGRLFPWGNVWDRTLCVSSEYHAGKAIAGGAEWQAWNAALTPEQRKPGGLARPVGALPNGASWCGALDMAGNVWEWCSDWYQEDWYASAIVWDRNPECTNDASGLRVIRGGGFMSFPVFCVGAYRRGTDPAKVVPDLGFRVVLSP
jgi:iron(II)-dependent oxidoreductase